MRLKKKKMRGIEEKEDKPITRERNDEVKAWEDSSLLYLNGVF